jgi:hypothetical protein
VECEYAFESQIVTRFIALRFFAPGHGFICGNVQIKGEIPDGPTLISNLELSGRIEDGFHEYFEDFRRSPQRLIDVLTLEQRRFSFRVPKDAVFELFKESALNPWLFDPWGRMIAAPLNNCSFCSENRGIVARYRPHPVLTGLVTEDRNGDLKCCSECNEFIGTISVLAGVCEQSFVESVDPPLFDTPTTFDTNHGQFQIISQPSTAAFLDPALNALLGSGGATIEAGRTLDLYFVKRAIVSAVTFSEVNDIDVAFSTVSRKSISGDGHVTFQFPEEPIGEVISMTFLSRVVLKTIRVFGKLVERESVAWPPSQFYIDVALPDQECEWSEATRTAVYRFESSRRLNRVVVSVVDPDVQKLIVYFFLAGKPTRDWEVLRLPRVSRGARVSYVSPSYEFDEARVFYYDALPATTPHRIGFRTY